MDFEKGDAIDKEFCTRIRRRKYHKYDGQNFEEWAVRLSATFFFSLGLSLSINLKFLGSKIQ